MRSRGSSDPCPCGSGLIYKDCCRLRPDGAARPVFDRASRDAALSKLLAFAYQPGFDADHSVAESVFWGELLRRGAPDVVQRLLDADDIHVKYNSWFLFDWEIDGTTVADLFLEEPAAGLSDDGWRYLDALRRLHPRLYEVERVDRGRGVCLVDLWTGSRVVVTERLVTTHQIVTWDLVGARVAPNGRGGYWFEGGVYVYPAHVKEPLLRRFRQAYRRHQRRGGGDEGAFFKKHSALFHHQWLELVAFPEPPRVTTADGDPLMFCRVVFGTARLEQVRRAICRQAEVRRAADGRVVLHEGAARGAREIGRWSFEGRRIVFETTSQARAARGRAWLEKVAGALVQYRATSLETVEQTMDLLRRAQSGGSPHALPDADGRAVTALFDRHYRLWIDRAEPALGNRTPRTAARMKTWRPRVVELLKQMENAAARAALAGRPSYDFRWIWTELGLERAGPFH